MKSESWIDTKFWTDSQPDVLIIGSGILESKFLSLNLFLEL